VGWAEREVGNVARVIDVAAYILRHQGEMTAMKLQKLCYYCQAWHLVWEEQPLFTSRIEAWANGPVIVDLYAAHRGRFRVSENDFPSADVNKLAPHERETIDAVLDGYGSFTAHHLSELTHREAPWLHARKGLAPLERGNAEITTAAMAEFYDGYTSSD
jgi:uncharacterized phage-associated protein